MFIYGIKNCVKIGFVPVDLTNLLSLTVSTKQGNFYFKYFYFISNSFYLC